MNRTKTQNHHSKANLPLAMLAGLGCGLTFFFFGPFDIYAGNRAEFQFAFADVGWWLLLTALAVSLAVTGLLLLCRGKAFRVFFGIFFWLLLMGVVQGTLLNLGLDSLEGDTGTQIASAGQIVLNMAIWVITGALCLVGALLMGKYPLIRTVAAVALVMVLGMQLAGCISQMPTVFRKPVLDESLFDDASETALTDPDRVAASQKVYLSDYGLYQVSDRENIIIFVLDRLDTKYCQEILDNDPDFFDGMEQLKGFTYFPDHVSRYSRTYPAACYMITAVEQRSPDGEPFGWTANEYFNEAYGNSPFISMLKDNGYHIRVYMDPFYGYRSAGVMRDWADNVAGTGAYVIPDMSSLVGHMLALSAYRYLPLPLKSAVNVSTASFSGIVEYVGDHPVYESDDYLMFQHLQNDGLTSDGHQKTFIYVHLNGCHTPCYLGEDGSYKKGATVEESTKGCFRLAAMYIDELKRLGVFDNTTIIITGDHPDGVNDYRLAREARVCPVFFKPAHADTTQPLRTSTAQVSQANLHASLVKSAGLVTDRDWGVSYMDVPEGVDMPRVYTFGVCIDKKKYIAEYTVNGPGQDFASWSEPKLTPSADDYYR